MLSLVNIHPYIIWLTRVKAHDHLVNQDVNIAGDSLHNMIRNSVHHDVTVPWDIFFPGGKEKYQKSQCLHLTTHTNLKRCKT